MNRIFIFIVLLTISCVSWSQSMVQVKGKVFDGETGEVLDSVTVLVKGTSRIMQNKPDGSFSIFIHTNDTLVFGLYGYKVKYMCFRDSAKTDVYSISVKMGRFYEQVKEVTIYESRSQREIRRDLMLLTASRAYAMEGVDAFQSPITALYGRYSDKAKSKALLQAYEFELQKNKLIKELLDIYNKQKIIDIPSTSYRDFIEYLHMDWGYLVTVSDYDLAVYIKQKAIEWSK